MSAGISIAGIDHEFATLAMVTRGTTAFELSLCHRNAFGFIFAWERVAGVTF